jgi:hypothetical protein
LKPFVPHFPPTTPGIKVVSFVKGSKTKFTEYIIIDYALLSEAVPFFKFLPASIEGKTIEIPSKTGRNYFNIDEYKLPLVFVDTRPIYINIDGQVPYQSFRPSDPSIHRNLGLMEPRQLPGFSFYQIPELWWSDKPVISHEKTHHAYQVRKTSTLRYVINSSGISTLGYFMDDLIVRNIPIPPVVKAPIMHSQDELTLLCSWHEKGSLNCIDDLFETNRYLKKAACMLSDTIRPTGIQKTSFPAQNPAHSYTARTADEILKDPELWSSLLTGYAGLKDLLLAVKDPQVANALEFGAVEALLLKNT